MKRKLFAITIATVLLLAGCGAGSSGNKGADNAPSSSASGGDCLPEYDSGWDMGASSGEAAPAPANPEDSSQAGSIYQNTRAKLIRRAEVHIQTEQFDESRAALNKLVADCGGYFEVASDYGGSYRDAYANRSGEYTIRVPAEKYSQFFNSAGDLGYITNSTESSEDVGERYYDTETRLKTETMEDIISLENALSDVEYQIEQYSSELNRYDALVDFATFQVYLKEVSRVNQEVGETSSLGQRMAAGFQASVRGLGQGFQNVLIWASYNIFLLVVLAVVVGKRELKKLRKQNGKNTEE